MQPKEHHAHADTSRVLLLAAGEMFDLAELEFALDEDSDAGCDFASSGFGFSKSPSECLHRSPPRLIYRHLR